MVDQQTKTPLSGVVIHLQGIEHDVTTYQDGDFFRLLSPGVYNITVARVEYAMKHSEQMWRVLFLSIRYESETRKNIIVTNRSSTYVEFQLKRKASFDEKDQQGPSKIGTIYNQTKEFVLHRTVFLVIAGVSGLSFSNPSWYLITPSSLAVILSVIFASVVVYLRYGHHAISRSMTGFRRYEPLLPDPDGSPIISRVNKRRGIPNSHAIESDSDGGEETLFITKLN